jgi:poly-gamma-glutamate synthesis protein (capsule biosynthesis protein)
VNLRQFYAGRVIGFLVLFAVIGLIGGAYFYYDRAQISERWLNSDPALKGVLVYGKEYSGTRDAADSTTDILFVGDMNFDRYIRKVTDTRGSAYLFSCIDPLLKSADLVVGNLEGPITGYPSVSEGTVVGTPDNYRFTFSTSTAALLAKHNIQVVNIGNNHIGDFGREGISSTKEKLSGAGVSYFGGLAGDSSVHRMISKGIKLSFVSYNQFGGDSAEKVAELVSKERSQGGVVIVYAHWGEEYVGPTDRVRSIASLFVESGASLVIGSHPHVIQSQETIGNTRVYYSLGNFIFDQYWDDSVTRGLVVLAHISRDNITFEERVVTLNSDGRTCPL